MVRQVPVAAVLRTAAGTPYLQEPGVVLLARPATDVAGLGPFLSGLDDGFADYVNDPTPLPPGTLLCKVAGQICYESFGSRRTTNAKAARYFANIMDQGHGSVLEHANYTVLLYGVSRSLTHELVRHRAGFAYCLDGEAEVYSPRREHGRLNGVQKRPVSALFNMQATPHGRSRLKLLRLRCYDESRGVFTTEAIRSVVFSGIKPMFKVTLEDGKTITCTKEHRLLTPGGWSSLSDIVGGLSVSAGGFAMYSRLDVALLTNGEVAYKNREWLEQRYCQDGLSQADIADLCGVAPHCIRSWVRRHRLQKPLGSWSQGKKPWNKGLRYTAVWHRSDEDRTQIAQRRRGAGNHRWREGVTRLSQQLRADVDNLATVCERRHEDKLNGHELEYVEHFGRSLTEIPAGRRKPQGHANPLLARKRRIIAVEYMGLRPAYDIEMDGEHKNFVANGIVTHNSQVSQRYVNVVRFVERPEFQGDSALHAAFEDRIDTVVRQYAELTEVLRGRRAAGGGAFAALGPRDQRKAVQQTARALLPNETEAPIVVTGNVRAWRHVIAMRTSPHAESEIRRAMHRVWQVLVAEEPILFGDYREEPLPDGTTALSTPHPKV